MAFPSLKMCTACILPHALGPVNPRSHINRARYANLSKLYFEVSPLENGVLEEKSAVRVWSIGDLVIVLDYLHFVVNLNLPGGPAQVLHSPARE